MANKYWLSTVANVIDSVLNYFLPDMKNSVNDLIFTGKSEVRDETLET